MGTIPFPNIAEQAGEVAQMPQNALAEYARIAQIKQQTAGMQQQQQQSAQMAPGQLQEQQQQIEAQKRQFADQDALTKAITQYDPSKHTLADVPKLITQNGGSGQSALQAQQGLIAQRQKLTQLSDEQFAEQQKNADLVAGMHDQVSQAPPEQKQAIYQQGLQRLSQAGVDVSKESAQYPGDDVFAQHLPAIRLHSAIVAEAEKDRDLSTKEQEEQNKEWKDFPTLGVALNTQTGETKSVGGGGVAMSPAMMEAKYVALQQKKNSGQALSKDDAAWSKGYEHMKTLVPIANINLQSGLLNDQAKAMAAQLYQQTGQLPSGMRSPAMSAQVLNQAAGGPGTETPDIAANKRTYAAQTAEQKAFISGPQGQQLTAIGTSRNHMQTFKDTADALDNGNFLKANQVGNYLGMQFGSDKATNFNIAKSAFAGEVGKAFAGANVGVQDRQELMDKISAASSPAQLKGYADTADKLLEGKQKSLQQSYQEGMQGKPNFGGAQTGMIRARDPQGKLHEAPAGTPLPQGWTPQ
jgi:hypothetical protein